MIKKNNLLGFTLIELLLTIAMIFVMGGIASAYLGRTLLTNATQNTADYIAGTLRKAQSYAMSGKNSSKWGVTTISNQLVLFSGNSYATRDTSQDQIYNLNPNINITGLSEVVFYQNTGTPSGSLTITLTASGNSKSITLNNQGIVNY